MFTSKFDNNELTVIIDEPVQQQLKAKRINPTEVFRLIESFASKILSSKQDDLIKMTNDETGANLELVVKWEGENKVVVTVAAVNLENLNVKEQAPAKVNLAEILPEHAAADTGAETK